MDNNSSGQRATPACRQDRHNGQRNSYPQRDAHRSWHGERQSPVEDQQRGQEDRSGETINAPHQGGPQKTFKTFRDLAVWQKGISLAKTVYQKTGSFPKEELYGLVTQMREAAVSIPANIAEGYLRKHAMEFQQFLNVALGSLGELETHVVLAGELNYLSAENSGVLSEELDHLARMTISLCNKVQR